MTDQSVPIVRLALEPRDSPRYEALKKKTPVVRLATTTAMLGTADTSGKLRYPMHKDHPDSQTRGQETPTVRLALPTPGRAVVETGLGKTTPIVRLAHLPGAQGDNTLMGQRNVERIPESSAPALLVSYVFLDGFAMHRDKYIFRDWVMDSGAFSAWASGTKIDLGQFIETARELLRTDPTLTEVFALDVVGNWKATRKNTEAMWKAGVPAIPTYHLGEPWDALMSMAKEFPKIALGGMTQLRGKQKLRYALECFSRVWPKRIHGFGAGSEELIMACPWESTDATSWEIGPCGFGTWRAFGPMSVRGSGQNLRAEIEWYLALERRAQSRWKKEMAVLQTLPKSPMQLG